MSESTRMVTLTHLFMYFIGYYYHLPKALSKLECLDKLHYIYPLDCHYDKIYQPYNVSYTVS
jgi:hypothetical protein